MLYFKCQQFSFCFSQNVVAKNKIRPYLNKSFDTAGRMSAKHKEGRAMAKGISAAMFKKLKDFLVRHKPDNMTPAEAHKIQKASYALSHAEVKKRFSPTYEGILVGLGSDEKQIFEASAWYLGKIAVNKPKYQAEIIDVLEQKSRQKGLNPEFRDYLKLQIQNILSKNNH